MFAWAIHRSNVELLCEAFFGVNIIESEYGEVFTGAEFLEIIQGVENHKNSLGQYFC